ncbi:MAG: hypothetical protein WA628_18680, partial [Terriglobales bacterium]
NRHSTAFINPTPWTIQVTDVYTHFSDPRGKAFQRETEPPLNVVAQLFGDGYVLSVNFQLHLVS